MQTEPEEAVLLPASWRSLGTLLSFLGQSWGLLQCPPLKGSARGRATATGENWGALCSCALHPPEGAGAFVSLSEVGGAVGEGSSSKDFGVGPYFMSSPAQGTYNVFHKAPYL